MRAGANTIEVDLAGLTSKWQKKMGKCKFNDSLAEVIIDVYNCFIDNKCQLTAILALFPFFLILREGLKFNP